MSEDLKKLEIIINLTDRLIAMAEVGEWDKLLDLDVNRANLISELFENQPEVNEKYLAESIQYILDKNQILKLLSLSERDSIAMEMSKANHGHKAVSRYLDTA